AGKALLADSLATVTGAIFGTSTTTSYVESTAGVAAGARTGFAAVVTGVLFLVSLLFYPLLSVITSAVTAPALIIVGVLMVSALGHIEWNRFEIAVPRSEEHTSELQSRENLVCRLLLDKNKLQ